MTIAYIGLGVLIGLVVGVPVGVWVLDRFICMLFGMR